MDKLKTIKKISAYVDEKGYDISANEKELLMKNVFYDFGRNVGLAASASSCLDLLPKNKDAYREYASYLAERYSLNQNVLEAECGRFPALSHHLAKFQAGRGTITAFDPLLVIAKEDNVQLSRSRFGYEDYKDDYNLVTSMYPSKMLLPIIIFLNERGIDYSFLTSPFSSNSEEIIYFSKNSLPKSKNLDTRILETDYHQSLVLSSYKKRH